MSFDKSKLLANRVPTGEVEIPGVGVAKIRGMSRQELIDVQKFNDTLEQERHIIAMTFLDPVLTVDEVKQWQASSAADEISAVALEINKLSGVHKDANKEAFKSV